VRAYHLAAIGTAQPDAWLYLASAANQAENDELCVEAYTTVFHLSQGSSLDLTHLNALAGALDNVGDAAGCEQIARRMLEMARGDKTFTANATHHLACAFLAQKRFPEAIQHAQQALQTNPMPENQGVFMDTLQRAQRGDPRPVPQRPHQMPEGQAFLALENGDVRTAQQLAQTNGTWKVWRAAFAAYEFRFESDNNTPCTKTALDCANWLLGSTAGSTDLDALIVRARALRLREGALFAIDPPPPLGPRMSRDQFQQMFMPRAGAMPTAPAGSTAGSAPAGGGAPTTAADMVLFPGTKLPRLIDYVNLVKAVQSGGNPMTVVAKAGMDMGTYAQLSTQWAQKMAADPNLAKRFQELMSG
jgi:tetratricopeptide (TPR) repeat protein